VSIYDRETEGLRRHIIEAAQAYVRARVMFLEGVVKKATEQLGTARTTWVPETYEVAYADVIAEQEALKKERDE
jgi:hypothetical protein